MLEKIVIAGPASQGLAFKVAKLLNCTFVSTETKTFPDNECYLRLEITDDKVLEGKDAIIIQSTSANALANQNQRLVELLMMIGAVKQSKPAKIRVIVPYLAYGRQDKVFRPGETIFANDICRFIEAAGATEFYSIDVHDPDMLKTFKIPAYNLNPMEALATEIKKWGLSNPVVVCPDKGAYERSRNFAKYLGPEVPVQQIFKTRNKQTGEIKMEGTLEVQGKDVIIADDIIATGGTMTQAIVIAKKFGARSTYAVGTHTLLLKNAQLSLLSVGTDHIVGTDTLETCAVQVSMAEIIANALKTNGN